MQLKVKVIPKSSQNKIIPVDDFLKIKITTAPEKGKANKQVIKMLAKKFNVPTSQIEIVRGLTSQEKIVKIDI